MVDLIALSIGSADQLTFGLTCLPAPTAAPSAESCPAVEDICGTDAIAVHQPVLQVRWKSLVDGHILEVKERKDCY